MSSHGPIELSADTIISMLSLAPHPEGGFYRETFRDPACHDGRSVATAIYFLLTRGQQSRWHRVDASEIWHWYAGAPLELNQRDDAGLVSPTILGCDLMTGERPQLVVPRNVWQSARSLGDWTLVGCTVAPGFEFSGFQLDDARS